MAGSDYDSVSKELAALVRGSFAEVNEALCEYMARAWGDNVFSQLSDDQRMAWVQYDLARIADTIETAEGEYGHRPVCPGVDLLGSPGRELLAPAEAVGGQMFTARRLASLVQAHFCGDPVKLEEALGLLRKTLQGIVMVDIRNFQERVQGELDALGALSFPVAGAPALEGVPGSGALREDGPSREDATFGALTPREREVVSLVAEGLTNGEIAQRLGVAQSTVKNHVRSCLEKLGYERRAQLGVYAACNNLIG